MPRGESKYADDDVVESKFDGEAKTSGTRSKGESKFSEDVTLIMKATNFCFSSEFIGIFQKYIEDNAYVFFDSVDSGDDEHKLEYHDLFKDYLELYESTMEDWLQREGITLKEFNEMLKEAHDDGKVSEKYFVKLLVASGEYDCFHEVMMSEAKRQRLGEADYDPELEY